MKTILITGASSGIGEATARRFSEKGATLILTARNKDKLDSLKAELEKEGATVHTYSVDVRERNAVEELYSDLKKEEVYPDVLINNAGLALGLEHVADGDPDDWDQMIDTNIKGLLYMTRGALQEMIVRDRGHIVNIGSVAGTTAYANGAVYCATKAAVRFISDALRQEVVDKKIKITNIQPGLVETNFSNVRFHGDDARADSVYEGIDALSGADIAESIYAVVYAGENVHVADMTIMPTHQAGAGLVHKK